MRAQQRRNFRRWTQLALGLALVQLGSYAHIANELALLLLFAGFVLIITVALDRVL